MVAKVLVSGQDSGPPVKLSRRDAILDAATELFAERGLAGVSIQEIARSASTHKATVLYHFKTKEALHGAVLDEALGRIAAVMHDFLGGGFASDQLRERVAYLIDQIQAHFAERPAHARLLERELLEVEVPNDYLVRFVERIYMPAVRGLEVAMEQNLIRQVDPAFFIHDMHVLLVGYFCHRPLLERLKSNDPYAIDALIARRNHLVEIVFSLLRPYEAG